MALGVFAFAIVAILGLLSLALSTSAETTRDSAQLAIVDTLNSMSNRDAPDFSGSHYFDSAGNPVEASDQALFYRASLRAVPQPDVDALFGLSSDSSMRVWSITIEYPSPAYAKSEVFIIGNARR